MLKDSEQRGKNPASIFEPSYTITSFCRAEGFTRPEYYKLKRNGRGPKEMRNGRCIRISHRARLDWQKKMEQPTEAQVAADEELHRHALAAGAAAVASPRHVSKTRRSA